MNDGDNISYITSTASSSIENWIDGTLRHQTGSLLKRKSSAADPGQSGHKRRHPLHEFRMDPNIPASYRTRSSRTPATPSRRSRQGLRSYASRNKADEYEPPDNDDRNEDTPRPPSDLQSDKSDNLGSTSSGLGRAQSQTDSQSNKSRQSSPVKRNYRALAEPIKHRKLLRTIEYDLQEEPPPPELISILVQVDGFSNGIGVIAREAKDAMFSGIGDRDPIKLLPSVFDSTDKRDSLGATPRLEVVKELCDITAGYEQLRETEAAWNCASHGPIGNLAMSLSVHKSVLRWANITTAQILPRDLIPKDFLGSMLERKMVDFAIVLRSSTLLHTAFKYVQPVGQSQFQSYNQTKHHTIVHTPIAVNIETKREGEQGDRATDQLTMWVAAQFNHLRDLLADTGKQHVALPVLPLVVVQGKAWSFMAATQDTSHETTIWYHRTFGEADSPLGIFQIIATLQYLMHWSQTVYRPWFEENAIPAAISSR